MKQLQWISNPIMFIKHHYMLKVDILTVIGEALKK